MRLLVFVVAGPPIGCLALFGVSLITGLFVPTTSPFRTEVLAMLFGSYLLGLPSATIVGVVATLHPRYRSVVLASALCGVGLGLTMLAFSLTRQSWAGGAWAVCAMVAVNVVAGVTCLAITQVTAVRQHEGGV